MTERRKQLAEKVRPLEASGGDLIFLSLCSEGTHSRSLFTKSFVGTKMKVSDFGRVQNS